MDLVGTWEHIMMKYRYSEIQNSFIVNFNENNSVSGSITGSWSFDESSNILTINNDKVIVEDAWDWGFPKKNNPYLYWINLWGTIHLG